MIVSVEIKQLFSSCTWVEKIVECEFRKQFTNKCVNIGQTFSLFSTLVLVWSLSLPNVHFFSHIEMHIWQTDFEMYY